MKWLIIAFALLVSTSASAEVSLAAGADIYFDTGHPMVEIRYFGEKWSHWSVYAGTDQICGIELYATIRKFDFGLGLEHAIQSRYVDTSLAYQLRVEYKFRPKWGIGIKHRSNCATICNNGFLRWAQIGESNSRNAGYNFLYLRRRF